MSRGINLTVFYRRIIYHELPAKSTILIEPVYSHGAVLEVRKRTHLYSSSMVCPIFSIAIDECAVY